MSKKNKKKNKNEDTFTYGDLSDLTCDLNGNFTFSDWVKNTDISSYTINTDISTCIINTGSSGGSSNSSGAGGSASGGSGGSAGSAASAGNHIHTANAGALNVGTFTNITFDSSDLYTFSGSDTSFTLNDELGDLKKELAEDEKLREENPSLQDAWDQYQLIRKLVQEEESDKYIKDKYKGFGE